jgi:hypothetical protein
MSLLRRAIGRYRLASTVGICAVASIVLGLLGCGMGAAGVGIGVALFVVNLGLLHEIGRALLSPQPGRWTRLIAGGSSVGRILLLAVALSLVFVFLGKEALLGACGGLFVAQVNLHFGWRQIRGAS